MEGTKTTPQTKGSVPPPASEANTGPLSTRDVVEYSGALLLSLQHIAEKNGFDVLAHLLRLAREEAARVSMV